MNKSLSIPDWHQMAIDGKAPPVRIQLNGGSMFPLVRMNRDYVTIVPPDQELVPGNIVLFSDADMDRYVVHRVWKIHDGQVLTWGDNCLQPDAWISMDKIWGRVVLIERGKRQIIPEPEKGLRWARFWHHGTKVYRLYRRYRDGIVRRIKKLFA